MVFVSFCDQLLFRWALAVHHAFNFYPDQVKYKSKVDGILVQKVRVVLIPQALNNLKLYAEYSIKCGCYKQKCVYAQPSSDPDCTPTLSNGYPTFS